MPQKKRRHGNLQTQAIVEETPVAEVTSVRATSNDQDPTDTNTEHVVVVVVHAECEGGNQQRTVPRHGGGTILVAGGNSRAHVFKLQILWNMCNWSSLVILEPEWTWTWIASSLRHESHWILSQRPIGNCTKRKALK